jgi:hypothetical protein
MTAHLQHLRQVVIGLLLAVIGLLPIASAHADAGSFLSSTSYADLQSALEQTRDPQRLADLEQLSQAVATSSDRAQLTNASSHNVGVFARYKKEPADAAASFYVLAPGHATDDDYALIALLLPPQVGVSWGDQGNIAAASTPRLLPILEGEQLNLSDPTTAGADGAVTYQLNLPGFGVDRTLAGISELPDLNQSELDQQPETAPLD